MDASYLAELTEAIAEAADITPEQAEKAAIASEPLYRALGDEALTDGFGGSESLRVIPATIAALLLAANPIANRKRRAYILLDLLADTTPQEIIEFIEEREASA
jgi:hypothetical protein